MEKVDSLQGLYQLALERKAVFSPALKPWCKPTPAAFVINLQGRVILNLLKHGLYVWEKNNVNKHPISKST